MKKLKKITLTTTITLIILLNLANILVSGTYATKGSKLQQLNTQKEKLLDSNRLLQQKIYSYKSLSKLKNQAQLVGYQKPSEIISVIHDQSQVASRN